MAGPAPAADPPPERPEKLWEDLASADAKQGYAALCQLASRPAEALPLLRSRLRPAAASDPAHLARLLKALDSDEATARDKAARELASLGPLAAPTLRAALEAPPSAEVKRRIEDLLERLAAPLTAPEALREVRAVEVLERIGSADARGLLGDLARGAPEARLTREAQSSLARLAKRPTAP
jgi:hypothetical protein